MGATFSVFIINLKKLKDYITKQKKVKCDFVFNLSTNFTAVFAIVILIVLYVSSNLFPAISCSNNSPEKPEQTQWNSYCWNMESFILPKKTADDPDIEVELLYYNKAWLPLMFCTVLSYVPYMFFKVSFQRSKF